MDRLDFEKKPEIVIGLVGAVGTDLDLIKQALRGEVANVGYQLHELRLSDLLQETFGGPPDASEDRAERIGRLMDQGDQLRSMTEHPDAVALLAIAAIRRHRSREGQQEASRFDESRGCDTANAPLPGHAFVLHSLKTPAEVHLLRDVYGGSFFLVAGYSRIKNRSDRRVHDTTKSRSMSELDGCRGDVNYLIQRDEKDNQQKKYGQNVQETFAMADLFLDIDDAVGVKTSISRCVRAFFSYQFHTPSRVEYGMFHAQAAALRSADLSRQVGAAITTPEGDIVAVGCNEVPKAGGGMYWEGDAGDARDHVRRHDSSHMFKREIMKQIYDALVQEKKFRPRTYEFEEFEKTIAKTSLNDILEFGRIIHAEMAALIDASRRGLSVRKCTMYVTTFPCHMCARHIIAAGIERVIYIEPYPKSKVRELYGEVVRIDGSEGAEDAVLFEPFVGVAPRQYIPMFTMPGEVRRKDPGGYVVEWDQQQWKPRLRQFEPVHIAMEKRVESHLATLMEEHAEGIDEFTRERAWHRPDRGIVDRDIARWLASRRKGGKSRSAKAGE